MEIAASTDYLSELGQIKKRQLYKILNQLEEYGYIHRKGFTNRKKLTWIHCPKSSITVIEEDTSALECSTVQQPNTSALEDTKLVHSSALNYCTPVHTYNKDNIKDYKKLTTKDKPPSSSSFFLKNKPKSF